jgi:ABC-type xylose transport system substrate-binding protein
VGFKYETTIALHHLRSLIVTNQEKIDAIAVAIDTAATGLAADIQALKDAVAAGQTLNFTALDAKIAALQALDAQNPPAPTP